MSRVKEMHLGYDTAELAESPYARFFNPQMAPLQEHIKEALLIGSVAPELMYPVEKAAALQDEYDWPVENGFALTPDGAARVFCLTKMPGVTPQMWDWWFAWHGSDPQRYKLWHPRAHVHVAWQDGRDDLTHYLGRTSNIVEYLGAERVKLGIRFVNPASMGFDEKQLAERGEVAICARASYSGTPMETAWLVHHVRPVAQGSEMRSRMWVGGNNVCPRGMTGAIGKTLGRTIAKLQKPSSTQAASLLVHGAQEMAHLAVILPEIYTTFNTS